MARSSRTPPGGFWRWAAVLAGLSACRVVERPWQSDAADVEAAAGTSDATAGDDAVSPHDAATPSGCASPAESERVAAAWALLSSHAFTPSRAFSDCLLYAVFSPSVSAFREELLIRIRALAAMQPACGSLPPGSSVEGVVRVAAGVVTFDRAAVGARTAAELAGAALHEFLHGEHYAHITGERGEHFYGPPLQVERCLLAAAGAPPPAGAPELQTRDRMSVESELQPFGYLRTGTAPSFLHECPPGTWVAGLGGTASFVITGTRLSTLAVRCQAEGGSDVTSLGELPGARWTPCPEGSVGVGVQAEADNEYVYDLGLLCAPWADVRARTAEGRPVGLLALAPAATVTRTCPPGQVLHALAGMKNTVTIYSLAAVCRDPDRPRIGGHRDLAELGGMRARTGIHRRRRALCADQGVLVGLYGHRSPMTGDLVRLGGICRGTAFDGDALGFRRTGASPDAPVVPEHVTPGVGVDPTHAVPPAVPFDELPEAANDARCAAGMGLVGLRVRRGTDNVPQHVQGLCAPLAAWLSTAPPDPTPVTFVGAWNAPASGVETAQCGRAEFLAGLEVEHTSNDEQTDVIERVVPVCRSFARAP
ncbi:MAG: hypothetical protein U0324_26275 [Polyangiales bacterium]